MLYKLSDYQLYIYKIDKSNTCDIPHNIMLDGAKCLVIAPHPDDELIACGGTIITYPQNFDVLCLATSGWHREDQTPEQNSRVRFDDFNTIMAKIGVNRYFIFEYFDSWYCHEFYKKTLEEYMKCVNVSTYDYIFLPHVEDNHPDHQYVFLLLQQMISKQGYKDNLRLAFYEVWSPLMRVNAYVNIDRVIMKKRGYLQQYRTVGRGYIEPITGLNRYRGLTAAWDRGAFLECFEVVEFKSVYHAASY